MTIDLSNPDVMFWVGAMGLAVLGIGVSLYKIAKGGLKKKTKADKAYDKALRT